MAAEEALVPEEPNGMSLARGAVVLGVLAAIAAAFVGLRARGDDRTFLHPHPPARWIAADEPFSLQARVEPAALELMFVLPESTEPVSIEVWSTGEVVGVREDGRLRAPTAPGRGTQVAWSFLLEPSTSERRVAIGTLNRAGPAVVAVSTSLDGVASGPHWQARSPGKAWAQAVVAEGRGVPALAREFPPAPEALARRAPLHGVLFLVLLVGFGGFGLHTQPAFAVGVRWFSLVAVGALAAHNLTLVPLHLGFDPTGHAQYIQRLASGGGLPLPGDGWQMFQAPLYYLVSAGLAAPLELWFAPDGVLRSLRIIPLAAGLAQIELSFRASRLVLPARPDLQAVGTLVGGFLPMNLYMSQYLGNEPLAGALIGATLVAAVAVVTDPRRIQRRSLALSTGVVLGLALLTKVSAVIVVPVVMAAFGLAARRLGGSRFAMWRIGQLSLATACVAGWYYARTWVLVGTPFVGGWDSSRGIEWWQDPGYRTWAQLLSFGRGLTQPIYAATGGIWDSLWSTMWADAFLGSAVVARAAPPWNMDFLLASTLLSIIPAVLMGIGILRALDPQRWREQGPLLVAVGVVGAFVAALLMLYLDVPIYSTAKATYTLGATPAYAVLAAAGAGMIRRPRWSAAVILAALGVWSANSWLGYWAV